MVFGEDLLENVRVLPGLVDHIEIILFFTPSSHNIPSPREMRLLRKIGEEEDVSFSVHLPVFLELASPEKRRREDSLQLALELCFKTGEFNPAHYVLHIPYSPPTLVPIPGLYFTHRHKADWDEWTKRALGSLEVLHDKIGQSDKLLVENINYSPSFLEPFWRKGFCGLCIDLGHLLLGKEDVLLAMKQYLHKTGAIHVHGVKRNEEHLSLAVFPKRRVRNWLRFLMEYSFHGVIVMEVFSPKDFEESIDILLESSRYGEGG